MGFWIFTTAFLLGFLSGGFVAVHGERIHDDDER
jgi:hypothetical protein